MGYYEDLWKQIQSSDIQAPSPQEPPAEEPEAEGLLPKLDRWSQLNQQSNFGALSDMYSRGESPVPMVPGGPSPELLAPLLKGVTTAAGAAGQAIGAIPAAIGSGLLGQFKPPILRSGAERLPLAEQLKAAGAGMEAGSTAAKEMLTPLDVASMIPGPVGIAASGADVALGAGDIYGGVTEGNLPRAGMGVARVAGNLLGIKSEFGKLKPPPTGKPKLDAALAVAKAENAPSPIRVGGEDEFFTGAGAYKAPSLDISPEAQDILRIGTQNALMEGNKHFAAKTGNPTPVRNVVLADAQNMATGPDGAQFQVPGRAMVAGDTIFVSREGQGVMLQADDMAGVSRNIADLIGHEVGHPARAGWRGEQPGAAVEGTGHAEGRITDDRTADLDQVFSDWEAGDAIHNSPAMQKWAVYGQETGALTGAFQGATGVRSTAGTYGPDILQLAHELTGRPAPSILEAADVPRHPEVELGVEGLTPPPKAAPPRAEGPISFLRPPPTEAGRLSGGKVRTGPPEEIPVLPDEYVSLVEAGPAMRALTGRQPKPARVIDVQADAPTVWSFLRRTEAGESTRGLDAVKALEELETLSKAKKLGQGTLERVGVPLGGLWPIRNRLNQTIRRVYGADSPRGIELQTRLNKISQAHPRAFRQSSRFFEQPEAAARLQDKSLRRAQPMFRQTPREAGKLDKLSAALERTKALEGADDATRARAKAALAEVIREGNLMPPKTEPERLAKTMGAFGGALTRLRKALSSLGPKERVAAVDRAVQGEERTRLAAWRLEREAAAAKKAEAGVTGGAPRLAPPPKGKQAGGAVRKGFQAPEQGQKIRPETGFRRLLQSVAEGKERLQDLSPLVKGLSEKKFAELVREAKAERPKPGPKRPPGAASEAEVAAKKRQATAAIPIGRAFPLKGEKIPRVGIERGAERVKVPVWKLLDALKLKSEKAVKTAKKVWAAGGAPVVRRPPKKAEPLHPQLLEEGKGKFAEGLRERAQALKAKPRIRAALKGVEPPTEVREIKPGETPTRGKFKAAPTKYRTDVLSKRVAAGANEPAPFHRVAAEVEADTTAFNRLENWLFENLVQRRTGQAITPKLIEGQGFTLRTRESLKRGLAQAVKDATPEEALAKFSSYIDEHKSFLGIKEKGVGAGTPSRLRSLAEKSPRSIMKELAAKWKEGRISPFVNRRGAWGAAKDKPVFSRELKTKDGSTIQDPIGGAKAIAREASAVLGREVSVEDVKAAGETSARPEGAGELTEAPAGGVTPTLALGKELSGPSAGKAKLLTSAVKLQKGLYSLADVVKHFVEKQDFDPELLEHPAYARIAEKQPVSAYTMRRTRVPTGGFEYATTGSKKAAGGVPETLQPLQPGKVRPTGTRPKRFDENVPAGMKTSKVGLSDFFTKGEEDPGANPFERPSINLPSPALEPGVAREVLGSTPLKGEWSYVQKAVKEGMEDLKNTIDDLSTAGRLKDRAYAEKMRKQKYDVPEIMEELSYSAQMKREVDPNMEYWVNWEKVSDFKRGLAEKAKEDFRAEYRTGKEKVLEKRLAEKEEALSLQEKRAALADLPLSAKTSEFLKASTPPKLLGDIAKWVDAKVKTGDIPLGQRNRAIELLRLRGQRTEQWAARKSKFPKVSEKDMVLYAPPGKQAGGKVRTGEEKVTLFSGGGSDFFTTNPKRAADYGKVREVTVPRSVFEAGRAQAKKLGQPSPQDTVLPNEWSKRAIEREDIEPDVYELEVPAGRLSGGKIRTAPPPLPPDVAANIEKISMARGLLKEPAESTSRAWDTLHKVLEYTNVTRPLMTAVDVSNPLRQTAQLSLDQLARDAVRLVTNPRAKVDVSFRKNITNMLKVFGSKERAEVAMKWITDHPEFKEAQRYGMRFITGGPEHESWIGKTILDKAFDAAGPLGKAPKWLVDGSERAFKWYQDKAMLDAYRFGKEWMYARSQELKSDFTTEDLRTMVKHINEAASRSKVTQDKNWDRALSSVFFSAQMTKSRAAQLAKGLTGYATYATPLSRSYGRRQMLRAITGGAALTGAVFTTAALAGLDPQIETDMRSTDFGKVKLGNITWDGGAGYFQFLRVAAQAATGQQKTRGTGEIKPRTLGDTLWNFTRSKLAPGPGLLVTAKEKRTFMGEPLDVRKDPVGAAQLIARDMLTPMSVRDMDEVIKENPRVAWLLPLMMLGTGLTSDVPSHSKWREAGRLASLKELATGEQDRSVQLREKELANRQELKRKKISPPNLTAGQITLPARGKTGLLKKYTLSPQEKEEFVAEYMPLVTDLLNEFINSNTYQRLPEDSKKRALYNRVHYLNQAYGTNTRARAKYMKKFSEGTLAVKEEE